MKQLKGKESVQGSGDFPIAWRGGQEAPAAPQRSIPELHPSKVPHSWGGWRSLCRAHGAAPGFLLGSLEVAPGGLRALFAVVGQLTGMLLVTENDFCDSR